MLDDLTGVSWKRRDVVRQVNLNPHTLQQVQRHRCGHAASSQLSRTQRQCGGIVGKNTAGFKLIGSAAASSPAPYRAWGIFSKTEASSSGGRGGGHLTANY